METVRHAGFIVVPSTVTNGKWWVCSEDKAGLYVEGYIHDVSGDFVSYKVETVNGRKRAFYMGEAVTLQAAINHYRER